MKCAADKDTLARNFSRYAHLYDKYADIQRLAARKLAGFLPRRRIENILEIGCGTGYYTALLANRFEYARITALDISEKMIDLARQRSIPRVEFLAGDAETYSGPCKYDLITSNATLQWFDDIDKAIAVYRASLAEKGSMAFSVFGPKTFCELDRCIKETAGPDLSISSGRFHGPEELSSIVRSHFEGAEIRERVIVERYGSLIELLNKIRYTGTRGYGAGLAGALSRGMLERIEDVYRTRYKEISVTYQIIFCKAGL